MTREELLLIQLTEECAEVSHRISKALRFGLQEKHPDHQENNAEMIANELFDLEAVMILLNHVLPLKKNKETKIRNKIIKIEKYLLYSKECGILK